MCFNCKYFEWCKQYATENKFSEIECRDIKAVTKIARPQAYKEFIALMELLDGKNLPKRPKKEKFEKVCPVCGRRFTTFKEDKIYCNGRCAHKDGADNNKIGICAWCGKEFAYTGYMKTKFCSKACLSEFRKQQAHNRRRNATSF